MKSIKKIFMMLTVTVLILLCPVFAACGAGDAEEDIEYVSKVSKTGVGSWTFSQYIGTSMTGTYVGVPFCYEFEGAAIEMNTLSDKSMIILDKYDKTHDWSGRTECDWWSTGKMWQVMVVKHDECPFEYEGVTVFQWATVTDWVQWENIGEEIVDDYIFFVARKDNNIVGFAVIYVWSDGEEGGGEVLEDITFTKGIEKVTQDYVDAKISEVIKNHKNSYVSTKISEVVENRKNPFGGNAGLSVSGIGDIEYLANAGKTSVGIWSFGQYMTTSALGTFLGVPFCYDYDGATIEMSFSSDKSIIALDMYDKTHDWSDRTDCDWEYGKLKYAKVVLPGECPFEYEGVTAFQWATVTNWVEWENRGRNTVDDYITFIARADNNILGFAVVYVWTDGQDGAATVLADVVFTKGIKNVTREYVDAQINEAIETHKKLSA